MNLNIKFRNTTLRLSLKGVGKLFYFFFLLLFLPARVKVVRPLKIPKQTLLTSINVKICPRQRIYKIIHSGPIFSHPRSNLQNVNKKQEEVVVVVVVKKLKNVQVRCIDMSNWQRIGETRIFGSATCRRTGGARYRNARHSRCATCDY